MRTTELPPQGVAIILRLLGDQGRRHWTRYAVAFACMALVAGATSATAWIMGDVIDKVFIGKDYAAVWIIAGAMVGISLVKGLASYGQQVALARVANAIVAEVQRCIFDKMLAMSVGSFAATHSTDFIARQAFISRAAAGALNLLITALARDALTLVGLTAVMVLQDPIMAGLALLIMPVAILGTRKLSGRVRKVFMTEFGGFAKIMESLQETAQGIRVVKAFTLEAQMRARQSKSIGSLQAAADKVAAIGARSSPLMETLGGVAVAMVVVYGGWRVIDGGQAPGAFFSFITALLLAYEPAKRLARLQIDLSASLMGVGMLYEFMDAPSGEVEAPGLPGLAPGPGRIEFREVDFAYRAGEPVLRGLGFVAEAGRTTALVGRSGAGKSTVMGLLLRYYDAAGGCVSIDGQDVSGVTRQSLRRAISYVSQEVFLFTGSVRDNIAFGREGAGFDEIEAAARAAHAHEFIMDFEQGYDTPCGEHGMQLSGGQRQRIAIARAFLKNAPILLLDEATSSLDGESERAVQDALDRLREGRTTLVIAHRLSTIQSANCILVMDGGRVVERGRHEELVKRNGSYVVMTGPQL